MTIKRTTPYVKYEGTPWTHVSLSTFVITDVEMFSDDSGHCVFTGDQVSYDGIGGTSGPYGNLSTFRYLSDMPAGSSLAHSFNNIMEDIGTPSNNEALSAINDGQYVIEQRFKNVWNEKRCDYDRHMVGFFAIKLSPLTEDQSVELLALQTERNERVKLLTERIGFVQTDIDIINAYQNKAIEASESGEEMSDDTGSILRLLGNHRHYALLPEKQKMDKEVEALMLDITANLFYL